MAVRRAGHGARGSGKLASARMDHGVSSPGKAGYGGRNEGEGAVGACVDGPRRLLWAFCLGFVSDHVSDQHTFSTVSHVRIGCRAAWAARHS